MRNFHYHIRGKIILPTKYKDIPIKDSVTIQGENGEVKPHYRLYTGDVVDPGADILNTLNRAFSRQTNPDIINGGVYAYSPGNDVCSDIKELQRVNIKGITVGNSTSLSKIDRNFSNIEVEYSDLINTTINSKKPYQLFFTVTPPPVATGDYNLLCPPLSNSDMLNTYYWCKGATFDNRVGRAVGDLCATVPPKKINDKTMKLGYFQSIPEQYHLYRVDIFLCTDETGANYLTLGDFNHNSTFHITPIISNSLNKADTCKKEIQDWDNRDNPKSTDTRPRDLQRTDYSARRCGGSADYPFVNSPTQGTGIGMAWSDVCEKIPLSSCYECGNHDCGFVLYWAATWQVETVESTQYIFDGDQGDCIPTVINCNKFYGSGVKNVGFSTSRNPNEAICEQPTQTRSKEDLYYGSCGDTSVITLRVNTTTTTYCVSGSVPLSVCGGSSQEVFRTSVHEYSKTVLRKCNGPEETIEHRDKYIPLIFEVGFPPVCEDRGPYGTVCWASTADCICCCNNCGIPLPNNQYFLLGSRKEITEYIINPFIFQTGTFLDTNGLPDFTAYMKEGYLPAWKRYMSKYVTRDANFYELFVLNPSCPRPPADDDNFYFPGLPGTYFFYNPNLPTTEGKILTPYTDPPYIGSVGVDVYNSEYKYEILPNPTKPLSRVYSSVNNGLYQTIYCRKPFRPSATSVYLTQSRYNSSSWQNVKRYFGYHDEYMDGVTYSVLNVDITKCTTFESESFLRTWIFNPTIP